MNLLVHIAPEILSPMINPFKNVINFVFVPLLLSTRQKSEYLLLVSPGCNLYIKDEQEVLLNLISNLTLALWIHSWFCSKNKCHNFLPMVMQLKNYLDSHQYPRTQILTNTYWYSYALIFWKAFSPLTWRRH